MKTFAKVVIMLVRLLALVELGLGVAIASARGLPHLKVHIVLGFAMSLLLLLLAILAAFKRMAVPVILGAAFAFLLPYIGLKQFPIKFGPALGWIQYTHVIVALLTIGVAEMVYAKIRRTA